MLIFASHSLHEIGQEILKEIEQLVVIGITGLMFVMLEKYPSDYAGFQQISCFYFVAILSVIEMRKFSICSTMPIQTKRPRVCLNRPGSMSNLCGGHYV